MRIYDRWNKLRSFLTNKEIFDETNEKLFLPMRRLFDETNEDCFWLMCRHEVASLNNCDGPFVIINGVPLCNVSRQRVSKVTKKWTNKRWANKRNPSGMCSGIKREGIPETHCLQCARMRARRGVMRLLWWASCGCVHLMQWKGKL